MKFTKGGDVTMTCLQEVFPATYEELVGCFGEPEEGDGYKVQAEWILTFEDGTVATIYDWKMGECYWGEGEGVPPQQVGEWHIGGYSKAAALRVRATLRDHVMNVGAVR